MKPIGVDIEELTAVQVALLTFYDICMAVDQSMIMTRVQRLKKTEEPLDGLLVVPDETHFLESCDLDGGL